MTPDVSATRRRFLVASSTLGAGLLGACVATPGTKGQGEAKEVTATEDLMREHGVLRRALLVYQHCAVQLRHGHRRGLPEALARTAQLFRRFGEDYHERQLEEAHIFPALRQAGGPAARYVDVLTAQHQRGREITDYIHAAATKRHLPGGRLARVLDAMVLMYQHHTAREDTDVFPAWKAALSARQYDEIGDKFEQIERQTFGRDGFEDALKEIAAIEETLGMADISRYTAPAPPHA